MFEILKDHQRFSSAAMGAAMPLPTLTDDPPRHTQMRSIVNKAFTTSMLKGVEPDIGGIANDLVGALSTDGGGTSMWSRA